MAETPRKPSELEQAIDAINPAFVATGLTVIGDVVVPGLGSVAGGLATAAYAFRQWRADKNFRKMVERLEEVHQDKERAVSEKWQALGEERKRLFKERFFPTTADYVADQKEEENIPFFVETLVSAIGNDGVEAAEFDDLSSLLAELRNIDIVVLYDLSIGLHRSYAGRQEFLKELKITEKQFDRVQQRLFQRGLLVRDREKNDEELLKRIVEQVNALKEVVSDLQSNRKTYRGQVLHLGLDRSPFEHIGISELGWKLIKFAGMKFVLDKKTDASTT